MLAILLLAQVASATPAAARKRLNDARRELNQAGEAAARSNR